MTVLVVAGTNLRRLIRERGNLFFVFVLPLLLILVLGVTIGGDDPRIGIHVAGTDSPSAELVFDRLEGLDGVSVERFDDLAAATNELEREDIAALVVIPDDYGTALAAGEAVDIEYRVIPTSDGRRMLTVVGSAIAGENAAVRATRLVVAETGISDARAQEQVAAVADRLPVVAVDTVDADGGAYIESDAVGFVAAQQLVLFVFLMGMVAASALVRSRQLGVTRRMLATPASPTQIVVGEGLGRFGVAMLQGAFIVASTALLFDLGWGSWTATVGILASFSLVATAAALLVGAWVSNENQTSSIGMSLGLALAALGGCMVPFELFPDWLRTTAHLTPHAWAVDAFTEVIQRGGGLGSIGTELSVLVAAGLVVLVAASRVLRRSIVG